MMKCDVSVTLCLAVALLCLASDQTLVSAKNAGALPTPAPLMTSTAKPTSAPKIEAAKPTEAMIINVPPKRTVSEDKKADAHVEATPALKSGEPVALQGGLRVKDAKPVQVTGFITKSGDIYEIEGKDGIGQIEGRQAGDSQTPNVCNYGSIVIYSDVPCDQVTNVQVSGVEQLNNKPEPTPVTEQPAAAPADVATPATEASPANAEADQENEELAGAASVNAPRGQAQRRRQQASNKRRRNGNKRNKNKRRGVQNGNRRRPQNGQRKRRRPQGQRQQPNKRNQQQQKRRRQQQQQQRRRRQQQKQQQQRRRQQQQQQQQRRRVNPDADFDARNNGFYL